MLDPKFAQTQFVFKIKISSRKAGTNSKHTLGCKDRTQVTTKADELGGKGDVLNLCVKTVRTNKD